MVWDHSNPKGRENTHITEEDFPPETGTHALRPEKGKEKNKQIERNPRTIDKAGLDERKPVLPAVYKNFQIDFKLVYKR